MKKSTIKPKLSFWIIGIIALLWNIMGVMEYLNTAYMTKETLQQFTQAEQDFYNNTPVYITAAFAIAVFAGTLGCFALLLRKKIAITFFLLSLIAVFVQFGYILLIQEYMEVTGLRIIMPILVIFVAIFLAWYSKKSFVKNFIS